MLLEKHRIYEIVLTEARLLKEASKWIPVGEEQDKEGNLYIVKWDGKKSVIVAKDSKDVASRTINIMPLTKFQKDKNIDKKVIQQVMKNISYRMRNK